MSAKPKKFSDGYLKKMGVDAEQVKDEYGCKPVSHFDIYNGETITIRDKKGILFYDTEMTKDEFFNFYNTCQEEEELWINIISQ